MTLTLSDMNVRRQWSHVGRNEKKIYRRYVRLGLLCSWARRLSVPSTLIIPHKISSPKSVTDAPSVGDVVGHAVRRLCALGSNKLLGGYFVRFNWRIEKPRQGDPAN